MIMKLRLGLADFDIDAAIVLADLALEAGNVDLHHGLARTLIALGRPADAIPHLQAALKVDAENTVAYYQVAQAYRALGDAAEQEKALAEFNRLRNAAERSAAVPETKRDVTPQVIDAKPPK